MPRFAISGLVVFMLALVPHLALAQTCLGLPDFDGRHFQVGGGVELSSQVTASEFGLTVGGSRVFAGVHVGPYWYSGGGTSTVLGFGGGVEIPLAPHHLVEICPNGSVNTERGPNPPDQPDVSVRSSVALAGLSFGARIVDSGGVQVAPSINVSVVRSVTSVTAPAGSASAPAQTYGVTDLGIGVSFSRRVTLRGGLAIPFHVQNSDTRVSLGVAFSF